MMLLAIPEVHSRTCSWTKALRQYPALTMRGDVSSIAALGIPDFWRRASRLATFNPQGQVEYAEQGRREVCRKDSRRSARKWWHDLIEKTGAPF
jgi:hypothetical protein